MMDDFAGLEAALKNKKRSKSSSLRRALSWLRLSGRKKKRSKSEGEKSSSKQRKDSQSSVASKSDDDAKWAVHYNPSQYQHRQENVFLPSARPPHLEDLHKEAELGLRSLQEQGTLDACSELQLGNGQDSMDNCSQISQDEDVPILTNSGSCAPDDEVWTKTRSLPPPTPDEIRKTALIIQPSVSSTGTTFKPQEKQKIQSSFKGPKLKEKRIRRTTIMGLPQHIQQELGLGKGPQSSKIVGRESFSDTAGVVLVSRGDEHRCFNNLSHSRARSSLRSVTFTDPSRRTTESISTLGVDYQHNWALINSSNRPKSLAVPKSSIPSELLQSPVMSMSPQATYLSKIIPNAILPPTVDVVMISTSQNCLRRLSSSGMLSTPSPACSRSISLQNYDGKDYASSDAWSNSQSSETIVSNNSTISSQGNAGTPLNNNSTGKDGKKVKVDHNLTDSPLNHRASTSQWVSACSAQYASPTAEGAPAHLNPNCRATELGSNGYVDQALSPAQSTCSIADASDTQSIMSERSIARSLSVKKMKKPPAPPQRMHSLQQGEEQNSELKGQGSPMPGDDQISSTRSCTEPQVSGGSTNPALSHMLVPTEDGRGGIFNGHILQSANDLPPQNLMLPNQSEQMMAPSNVHLSQSGTALVPPPSPTGWSKPRAPERSTSLNGPETSHSPFSPSLASSMSERFNLFVIPPPPSSPAPLPPNIKGPKFPTALSCPRGPEAIPPPPAGPAPLPPTKRPSFLFNIPSHGASPSRTPQVTSSATPLVTNSAPIATPLVTTSAPTATPLVTTSAPTATPLVTTSAPTATPFITTSAITVTPLVTTSAITVTPLVTTSAPTVIPLVTTSAPTATLLATTSVPTATPLITTSAPTATPLVTTSAPIATPLVTTSATPLVTTSVPIATPLVTTSASTATPLVTTSASPLVTTSASPLVTTSAPTATPLVTTSAPIATPLVTTSATPLVTTSAPTETPLVATSATSVSPLDITSRDPIITGSLTPVLLASDTGPVASQTTSTSTATSVSSTTSKQGVNPLKMRQSSPPPSPPPSHHPPPPPKKPGTEEPSPPSSSTALDPLKQDLSTLDWPLPPPPLSLSSLAAGEMPAAVGGLQDAEFLFPPPPPPFLLEDIAKGKRFSDEEPRADEPPLPAPAPLPPSATPVKSTMPEQSVGPSPLPPAPQPAEPLSPRPLTLTPSPAIPTVKPKTQAASQPAQGADSTPPPNACGQGSAGERLAQPSPLVDGDGGGSTPVVTPSLLQMVRLRSVQMNTSPGAPESKQVTNRSQVDLKQPTKSSVTAPSKPARKSLSQRLSSSSDSEPAVSANTCLRVQSPSLSTTAAQGHAVLKPAADETPHKSPASTASFIFSKNVSPKKLVFETPRSPEAEAEAKKNFMTELSSVSGRIASRTESKSSPNPQSKAVQESQRKAGKVPPPVAKKPLFLSASQRLPSTPTGEMEFPNAQALHAASDAKEEKGKLTGNGQVSLCKGE